MKKVKKEFLNIEGLTHLFVVMELGEHDLRSMLDSPTTKMLTEEHLIIILYNLLCAINHLHSANVMHRDIKSSNLLIDDNCNVKICDFGLARNIPTKDKNQNVILH